jgi:uncharacterized protein YjiS (DUF1127 family)
MEEVFKNMPMPCSSPMGDSDHRRRMHYVIEIAISTFDIVATWVERNRQRRTLANLPDYMLRDIGVSRVDAWWEAEKPFWRT